MKPTDLQERTLLFSANVMNFIESLPESKSAGIISGQIIRSSSSIGANYRAARRSKSLKDFINKLKIVEEEADETLYWLELISLRNMGSKEALDKLIKEANELVSIFVVSIKTAKSDLALQVSGKSPDT